MPSQWAGDSHNNVSRVNRFPRKKSIFEALGQIRANRAFSPIRARIHLIRVQSSLLSHFLEGRFAKKCFFPEIKQEEPQDRKTIFETLSLPVAKIRTRAARQAPNKNKLGLCSRRKITHLARDILGNSFSGPCRCAQPCWPTGRQGSPADLAAQRSSRVNDFDSCESSYASSFVVGRCCRGALLETGSQDPVATRVPT